MTVPCLVALCSSFQMEEKGKFTKIVYINIFIFINNFKFNQYGIICAVSITDILCRGTNGGQ